MVEPTGADVRRFTIQGWRVECYATLDSTSEEAKRRAFAGDRGELWIVADEQTAGRGRHGRDWRSARGNFHGSALLIDPCAVADAPQLGFVTGLAARAAAEDLGARNVKLKWPNDLVHEGAKLSGLLLEGWNLGAGRMAVAIGVGVNLASHPTDLAYAAQDLGALAGRRISARDFLERLAPRLRESLALFARGRGFADVRAQWLSHAAGLGESLRATTANGPREGVFSGLDARGRLLLQRHDAIETIESADIDLLGAAPSKKA